jgi:hypothetical protein
MHDLDREARDQLRGRGAADDPWYGAQGLMASRAGAPARPVRPEQTC